MMLKWKRIAAGRYFAKGTRNGYVIQHGEAMPEHGISSQWYLEVSQNAADDSFWTYADAKAAAQEYEDSGADVPAPWFVPGRNRMAY
jgi:hypothetical protein